MHYFIINPKSRSGRGEKIWKQIKDDVARRLKIYEFIFTEYPGHAAEYTSFTTNDITSPVTIVVLGGDGTLNEVINGIVQPELVTLGYIPTGSSNDFARSLGLCKDPFKALDIILNPKSYTDIDCGAVRGIENKTSRRFVVSSGIGFDASVTHEALNSPMKNRLNKFKLGKLTYVFIALKQILKLKKVNALISIDGAAPVPVKKMIFISAHIHRYEGGGFAFAPKADPQDGYLDLCVISNMSRLKILCLLPTAFSGKHVHFKGVDIYRCKKAVIKTKEPRIIHTDGETYGIDNQLMITCEQQLLHLING